MNSNSLTPKRSQELFKLILSLRQRGNIKVGFNETIKAINNNTAICAVIARDAVPSALVEPLPVLCEQQGVTFYFVDSKTALGKACNMEIDVLACAIHVAKHEDSTRIVKEVNQIMK